MTVREFLQQASTQIESAALQCQNPKRHAGQILEFVLACSSADLVLRQEEDIHPKTLNEAQAFLKRRLTGEPFQYIAGEEWFWRSRFEVGPGVLIPRRETEFVVEFLLSLTLEEASVVELGAGSGNIGISVLQSKPKWQWHGFERNPDSLPYLKKNVEALLPQAAQYTIHGQDFFAGAVSVRSVQCVVANPPYVPQADMDTLSQEVSQEPPQALAGGGDGLDIIRKLIPFAASLLDGGFFVTEIDFRQSDTVRDLLIQNGFSDIRIINDYSHRPRVVTGTKSPSER